MHIPKRIYHWLLKLYPARFREEFSGPLERQFQDEYREARNPGERATVWLRALADLTVSIPAQVAREVRQDLVYGTRVYSRRRVSTLLALAALALAIGATTGVFSVLNALLLRGLPFRDANGWFSFRIRLSTRAGATRPSPNGGTTAPACRTPPPTPRPI
jgi:hypothetical protein